MRPVGVDQARNESTPGGPVMRGTMLVALASLGCTFLAACVRPHGAMDTSRSDGGALSQSPAVLSGARIRADALAGAAPVAAKFAWPDGLRLRVTGARSLSSGGDKRPT